ncbi:MAG: hypothetical protein DCF25_20645 [Leptolyngbya foveolarum]|uniref:Uncharacterized protein n=1 Tax=Leptolyngbya foveolarum TaxID=47253 RepID=A0A2W4TUJ0_9CYAN|nr:MAG: hypothetical protein DCF25_20645 [Leptolyngbya foveolarum]
MANFNQYRHQLKRFAVKAVCLLMLAATVWGGGWVSSANAVGSEKAAEIMQDRAASELDRMAGEKSDDVLKEAARNTAKTGGTDAFNAGSDLDEAGRKLKGSVKRDARKAKSKAADIGDDIEDAAGSVMDSVKDLFN